MPANHKKISGILRRALKLSDDSGFGVVTYRKGGRCGPRWQTSFQLVILQRGGVKLEVDGSHFEIGAGMGILLAPGHLEEFRFSQDTEARHSWCQILPVELPENMKFPASAFYRVAKCPGRTMELIRLGLSGTPPAPGGRGETGESRAVTSLVIAAIWSFVASLDFAPAEQSLNETALARFHAAVEALGSQKATLDELARQAGVSRGHLIRIVRESMGITPMEAVWRSRVTRAARLLSESGLSIAEVADQTGFANAYHFSRRFRQQLGQPPRVWRMERWGSPTPENRDSRTAPREPGIHPAPRRRPKSSHAAGTPPPRRRP